MKKYVLKWFAFIVVITTCITSFMVNFNIRAYADETSNTVVAQIGTIKIDREQLEKNNYFVTVPVKLIENPGFVTIQFGAQWDTNQVSAIGARSVGDSNAMINYHQDQNFAWIQSIGMYDKTDDFCSITFQVNENIDGNTIIPINGLFYDAVGSAAVYNDMTMQEHPVEIIDGAIEISDNTIPEVTVEVGNVTVEKCDLLENDYYVDVPVVASENNGFYGMTFGLSWNSNEVSYDKIHDVAENIVVDAPLSGTKDSSFIQITSDRTYHDSKLFTIRFRVTSNAKPGNSFNIAVDNKAAKIININGEEGTLNLLPGMIRIKSTQNVSKTAYATISLPNITLTLEELEQNNYQIAYPICVNKNSAFTKLEFGVSCDSRVVVDNIKCNNEKSLDMKYSYGNSMSSIWIPFTYKNNSERSAYINESLCTLTLDFASDAAVGDVYEISADNIFYSNGSTAKVVGTTGENGNLKLESGKITIISEEEKNTDVSVEICNIEMPKDELKYTYNVVTIPVKALKNNGFSKLSFGISWDKTKVEFVEALSSDRNSLGVQYQVSEDNDSAWLKYMGVDPETGYVYNESNLGELKFRVLEGVESGETLPIYVENICNDGTIASVIGNNRNTMPVLLGGLISITGDDNNSEAEEENSKVVTKPTCTQEVSTSTTTSIAPIFDLSGDVDENSILNLVDLVLMSKNASGICNSFSHQAFSNADMDENGKVDCADVLLLMNTLRGI